MGRDILLTTALREEKLVARSMNCEVDHTILAKFIQTVKRTRTVDEYNKAGEVFSIRVCNKHNFSAWKDGEILKVEPIVEGVNNRIHGADDLKAEERAKIEVRIMLDQLGHFERFGTI